jgi:hypothetical protein
VLVEVPAEPEEANMSKSESASSLAPVCSGS